MRLIDYTHPGKVPPLRLPTDRRSALIYARLPDLPCGHPYFSYDWALFRYPHWLEAGAVWLHAMEIGEDLTSLAASQAVPEELRPVVGSAYLAYDSALARVLSSMGYRPRVAEVIARV